MARASAPPWEPTPNCRIAAVRAATSSALSTNSRLETYVRRNSTIWVGRTFFLGSTSLWSCCDALFWDICGDCLRFRERSNPLVIVKYVCSGATNYTRCAVKLSQLGYTFFVPVAGLHAFDSCAPRDHCLNCWCKASLPRIEHSVETLVYEEPRLGTSPGIGHRRRMSANCRF